MEIDNKILKRFWSKVSVSKENDCWLWLGARNHRGYGQFRFLDGVQTVASRVSYLLTYGEFDKSLLVCHSCDNPPCVNPKHLFLGTHKDNMIDRNTKGRQAKGEKNGEAALLDLEVTELVSLYNTGAHPTDLRKQYKISKSTLNNILRNDSYKHLDLAINKKKFNIKFPNEMVNSIIKDWNTGLYTQTDLSKKYPMSRRQICNVVNGKQRICA